MAIKITDPKLLEKYGKKPEPKPVEPPPKPDNTERLIQVLIENNERLINRLQPTAPPPKPVKRDIVATIRRDSDGKIESILIREKDL